MNSYGPVKPDLLARLSRIEGQVRGIRPMVEEDQYCIDIVTQGGAVRGGDALRLGMTSAASDPC